MLCSLEPSERQISDDRRRRIQQLDEAIGDPSRVFTRPHECLADRHTLLRILKDEYGEATSPLTARLYYDAFQIAISHSDQARASVFAARAYDARMICEGEDSPETRKMKGLKNNPAGHLNIGASQQWKTAKGMIPKGLDDDAFEKWLWKMGI